MSAEARDKPLAMLLFLKTVVARLPLLAFVILADGFVYSRWQATRIAHLVYEELHSRGHKRDIAQAKVCPPFGHKPDHDTTDPAIAAIENYRMAIGTYSRRLSCKAHGSRLPGALGAGEAGLPITPSCKFQCRFGRRFDPRGLRHPLSS